MTDYHESKIVDLIGSVDGVNVSFKTPTKFVSGTLRVIFNGVVYPPDDDRKRWIELSDDTITFDTAPRPGDILQAFYQDKDVSGQIGLDNVKGSPFDPNGVLP